MEQINELATPMEILEEALKREKAAYDFYASARDHVKRRWFVISQSCCVKKSGDMSN